MNEIQINTAIANALGWSHVRFDYKKACGLSHTIGLGIVGISPINNQNGLNDPDRDSWIVPNYLKDLNAMHEAEKVLDMDQQYDYGETLARMTIGKEFDDPEGFTPNGLGYYAPTTATATQRAEAFLKTLNLWK